MMEDDCFGQLMGAKWERFGLRYFAKTIYRAHFLFFLKSQHTVVVAVGVDRIFKVLERPFGATIRIECRPSVTVVPNGELPAGFPSI